MQAERWKKAEELYHAALALPAQDRAEVLRQACPADPGLCAEVESLLKAADNASSFLEDSPIASTAESDVASGPNENEPGPADADSGETAGSAIDRYHLLQKIGEGGMGVVWLAEQKEPVRRRVALKLVKAGMNTREVIARFESERQALALMDHPAIAKVFDAGSTPRDAPYFVMEYVAGVPVTAYCDDHQLSIRDRLDLFRHVCEGVQHAHQKAIIHRDLKPSNILVTEVDGQAVPKIIDFGVAKALTQKLTANTTLTRVGSLVGTPEYMSPEQASSSGEDIDTRSDVYSLGVIFYELLAGVPPLALRRIAFDEFLRRLREEEPPKPSTKVRSLEQATSTEVALKRQTERLALAKQLHGDLDSIALKALEKDRSRRYGSPSDFAADIGRYLSHEAVLAVPPSAVYRTRKFAHRYRAALATAGAFVLVLILAAGVSIWEGVRATRQRNRADAESAAAQAVNDFLRNDLLAQASAATQSGPSAKPDPNLKVRTALDRAAVRISGRFDRQPEVEAAIRDTIGQTYTDLGLYPEAETQLKRALDLYRRVLGPENPKTLKTVSRLARSVFLQSKYAEAEALDSQALEIQRRVLGTEHPDTLASMNSLANVYYLRGKYAQAEALYSKTLELRRRILGPEHPDTLRSMNNLAIVYYAKCEYAQAEALYSQTLEIKRRVLGPEHPETLSSMSNLGIDYGSQGKYPQAEALDSQALEIQRRVLGSEHRLTLNTMSNLADVYDKEGKYAQAEALGSQALEIQRRVLGPEHRDTLLSMNNLANVYSAQGKYAQAEALYDKALEIQRRVLGPENPDTLWARNNLAADYRFQGKYAQALALYNATLEISRRVLGPEQPGTFDVLYGLVLVYQGEGKFALAETYAAQALAGRRHALGSEHPDTIDSAVDLAVAYQSQGKFAESEPLAREAVAFYRKTQPDDGRLFRSESLLGASLAGQKRYAEAEPILLEGYRGMMARKDRIPVPAWDYLDRAREWIVKLYQAWGKPEKAAEWRKK